MVQGVWAFALETASMEGLAGRRWLKAISFESNIVVLAVIEGHATGLPVIGVGRPDASHRRLNLPYTFFPTAGPILKGKLLPPTTSGDEFECVKPDR